MLTPEEFAHLSTIKKLTIMFGDRVASLCHTIVMAEGNPFSPTEALQAEHTAGWMHRCLMHSHWGVAEVGNGEFTPSFHFGLGGIDVVQFDKDCDRFYTLCYQLTKGHPTFPNVSLDNYALSFTCPGLKST